MRHPNTFLLRFVSLVALIFIPGVRLPAQETPVDRDKIIHVLNRTSFGLRPGDVELVAKMGLNAYLQCQLHPETIDDSAVEKELARLPMLQMSDKDLVTIANKDVKKVVAALQKQGGKQNGQLPGDAPPPQGQSREDRIKGFLAKYQPADGQKTDGREDPEKMSPMDRMKMIMKDDWHSPAGIGQLEQAKLVRAIDSNRQLQEVLVDFWGNHFNIDMKKGPCDVLKIIDDREVIRPHIWGSFRDLLEASAKSPAMLFYLDNATNSVERTMGPFEQSMREAYIKKVFGAAPPEEKATATPRKRGGINENYAREIMELHTLGVDGGYTQKDVQEVARCFTGWTFDRQTGEFTFRAMQHDNGVKTVLGQTIPANGGIKDGERVLDILCAHPATAHHIAYEMCQRFVSDEPPAALVDRIAAVFTQSGGNLRQVTEAILSSPEFISPANYRSKIKSPFEFAVSAIRASDSVLTTTPGAPADKFVFTVVGIGVKGRGQAADRISNNQTQPLAWRILELGEPIFACTPPTGYKEDSKTWVSPGALIERLNFAMALTEQRVRDVAFKPQALLAHVDVDKPEAVLDQCVGVLLHNQVTDATRKVLQESALPPPGENKTVNPNKLVALILGSPEFQRK